MSDGHAEMSSLGKWMRRGLGLLCRNGAARLQPYTLTLVERAIALLELLLLRPVIFKRSDK